MIKQILNQNWRMRDVNNENYISVNVPSSVYTDLLNNNIIKDPFWKDREDSICEIMNNDFEYTCIFTPDEDLLKTDKVILHFDGLDTVATTYLNDVILGKPCNMHRIWEYDVTNILNNSQNTLKVILHSPLKYIENAYQKYKNIGNDDTYEGFMHLRKAHYMFGWDWGAHLPDAGIFRPVSLIGIQNDRIESVYITQNHKENLVNLLFETESENKKGEWEIIVTSPTGEKFETKFDNNQTGQINITNPQLWWPNGLGEQPLYNVCANLIYNGIVCDTWERKIGLRTMTIRREKDEWGESFAHEVNGVCFFAMGADYIPEDHLLGRRSKEKTRKLLEDCKLANFNVIRVWGGGFYPDDWFFDICDELGLVVWQDFMFACSVYELTEEFEQNIIAEFIDNVKRIRHHACLGLWCGNNEMEMFVDERCWVTKHTEVRDYLFMYERIIPKILKKYDPNTFYWPASPSSGGSFDNPNDPNRGDVHYWQVWHGNKPFSEYRKYFFRYISEFGFQALPCRKTIETFTDDTNDFNMFSYIMEKHQRNYGANGKIMGYMQQTYRYPTDFDTLIYASQLLQADGIRYGVEHFRRNRGRCMGAVYWQLNDCWPVISWSSIDYHGRWKALHSYAKRFFAPVLLSCEEQSWMTQEANMNRQHFDFEKSIRLNVSNETMEKKNILIKWQLRNAKSEILRQEQVWVTVDALSAIWLDKVNLPDVDVFNEYVSYQAYENDKCICSSSVIFSYPKYFKYENPELSYEIDGEYITVYSKTYAKSIEIQNQNQDLVLSDNYFDLNGDSKKVKIIRGDAKGTTLRIVYDIK